MKKLERLAEATAPDGTVLTLFRHDGAFYIRANGAELMSTRRHHSEEALAELACAPLRYAAAPRVLVGGLGFGFTLRAALDALGSNATVVVAELLPAVVEWNRDPRYGLSNGSLDDPRVEIRRADVMDILRSSRGAFDAIMLDVDNGAESFTTRGNRRLYGVDGIATTIAALRPGGRAAYWSDREDPPFERLLRDSGLVVETRRVRAHVTSGAWHTLIVGRLE